MTRNRKYLLGASALAAAFAGVVVWAWTPLAIDRCLDHGGKWSAESRACVFEAPRTVP